MSVKKYYWLKLEKDFFKRHDIRIIEEMKNGKDYIIFYLKLILESMNHEGRLRFSDSIPYSEEMLSTITNTDIDVVRSAIKMFSSLELMEIWDDKTLYLVETSKMVGSETEWAKKKRVYRKEQKLLQDSPGTNKDNVRQEIEKEIDIDIDNNNVESKDSTIPFKEIIDYLNEKANSKYRLVESNKKFIRARWNENYTLEDFKKVVDNKVAEWKDTDMDQYLRPSTLFGTKFDNYLNQSSKTKVKEIAPMPVYTEPIDSDISEEEAQEMRELIKEMLSEA